jgi:hypothetical protein
MLSGNADSSPVEVSGLTGENFSCVFLQLEGILSFWWWVSQHVLSKRRWAGKVIVKINYPPVPKTDTQVTENLDKAIFSWWRGCKHGLTPAKTNKKTHNGWQWIFLISLMQLDLHLTWDLSRSKVHNLSWFAKRLGRWVKACSLVGNGVAQKSRRRSKDSLSMRVTSDGNLRNF